MPIIRPCADLRNNYNEISRICHETNEPMYITRNGYNDLVILSDKAYESLSKKTTEEEIDRLISEHFDKHYATFEEFKENIINSIDKSINELQEGKGISMENIVAEMEAEYNTDK